MEFMGFMLWCKQFLVSVRFIMIDICNVLTHLLRYDLFFGAQVNLREILNKISVSSISYLSLFYLTLILLRLFEQHYCYNVTGQSQEFEGSYKVISQ